MSDDRDDIIQHPHDALFKRVFGEKANAIEHFRSYLPPEVRTQLDLERLELHSGSFVDPALKQRHADLLFSAPTLGDDEESCVLLYVLFEHQRTNDPMMALRLLRYMLRIWDRWKDGDNDQRQHPLLPPILPMVLYHGQGRWTGPQQFFQLLAGGDELKSAVEEFVPDFRYLLQDLSVFSPDEVEGTDRGQTALLVFKYIDELDVRWILRQAAALMKGEMSKHGVSAVGDILYYLLSAHPHSTAEEVIDAFTAELGEETRELAMSAAQELINKGLKKGLEQGRRKLLDLAAKVFSGEELEELRKLDDLNELSNRVMARIDERLAGT